MDVGKIAKAFVGAGACCALVSCAPLPDVRPPSAIAVGAGSREAGIKTTYAELSAAGGKVYQLDPASSTVKIYVFRGGRAASKGHNHVLSAPQFTGFAYVPPNGLSGSRFDLEFRLDQLAVDDPQYRAGLGDAFASTPTDDDIRGTREHMLGDRNLQAAQYPLAYVRSVAIAGELPKLAAKIEVELHGQKQQMWVPLTIDGLPAKLIATGTLVLRQTDFGIRPYSVFGGLLAVQDELVVEFMLVGSERSR